MPSKSHKKSHGSDKRNNRGSKMDELPPPRHKLLKIVGDSEDGGFTRHAYLDEESEMRLGNEKWISRQDNTTAYHLTKSGASECHGEGGEHLIYHPDHTNTVATETIKVSSVSKSRVPPGASMNTWLDEYDSKLSNDMLDFIAQSTG